MFPKTFCGVFINLYFITLVQSHNYEFLPENEKIFTPCPENPENDVHKIFDFSNISFEFVGEYAYVSGYATFVWDVEPTDRIAVSGKVQKFLRGEWQPTIFNIVRDDFCSVMYSKNEVWYSFWISHVIDGHGKCINERGAKLYYEKFGMIPRINNVVGADLSGQYRIDITFDAYDKDNVKKDDKSACFEMIGDLIRTQSVNYLDV